MAGTFTLRDSEQVDLSLAFLDAAGNPAPAPEGLTPSWASSDDTVITVTASDDGLSASAVAIGPLGTAQISVVDASLNGTLDVQVVAGDATQVSITPGSATPKP